MKRIALFAAAAAALALAGCETPTPYQPLGSGGALHSGGFTNQQLEQNRWTVSFSGNSLTSRQTVERYLLFRAAELTAQQGYDWFTTVDRNTERKSDYVGFDDDFGYGAGWGGYWGPRWGFYRRGFGWGYGYYGAGGFGGFGGPWGGGSVDLQQVSQYTATAEILMGHGAKPPGDRRAFTARAVIQHLQPTIQYPDARR